MKYFASAFMVLIIISTISCSHSNPAAKTIGSLLGDWSNQINTIIQNAQNAGLVLEVTGAAQADNLVEQMKILYEGELDKTVDAFSESEQKSFDDISKGIAGLEKGVTGALTNVSNIIAMLPGMKTTPQVTQCTGTIIAPNQENYKITVVGGFWDLPQEGYSAILQVNGQTIPATVTETNKLEFQIPKTIFTFSPNSISYPHCEIKVNYRKSKFLFFHSKDTATFKESFVILPPKFGELSFETTTLRDSTFIQPNQVCGPLVWSSKDGNTHQEIQGCDMVDGWKCDRNSVAQQSAGEEGRFNVDWFDLGNQSAEGRVQWKIMTTPKSGPGGHDGVRGIKLIYTRYQTRKVDVVVTKPAISLGWGEKIVLDIPREAIWKLTFTKYNGTVFQIASTGDSSSFVKLGNIRNRQLSVQTVPYDSF